MHITGWIYRVILEEAALEGRSLEKGKREREGEKEKEERGRKEERILLVRSEMGFSNWTRENSSVRRRTLDNSCSLSLSGRKREREREASLAAFPDRSVGNRRREKERLINRRKVPLDFQINFRHRVVLDLSFLNFEY